MFVRAGFCPGRVLGWKLRSGFPAMFSQQLEDRGRSPLSCKQKGQTTARSRRDTHTLLLGGRPHAARAPRWRRWPREQLSCFPITALAVIHAKASPTDACEACFHKPLFLSLLTALTLLLVSGCFTPASGKRPHLRRPTLKFASAEKCLRTS